MGPVPRDATAMCDVKCLTFQFQFLFSNIARAQLQHKRGLEPLHVLALSSRSSSEVRRLRHRRGVMVATDIVRVRRDFGVRFCARIPHCVFQGQITFGFSSIFFVHACAKFHIYQ